MNDPRISLIIPALNEAPAIGQVLDSLPSGVYSQVIVVDNGSTDGTGKIATSHGATVVRENGRGYGRACLAGIAKLRPDCDIVVFMDGDSSDDPRDALLLIEPIINNEADLVIGARRGPGVERGALTYRQRMGHVAAMFLIRHLYGFRYTDFGPFRAIRRRSLLDLGMEDRDYGWTAEMQLKAVRQGLRAREVPVRYRARIGQSKISGDFWASLRAGTKILGTILRYR
jgi:glycosyltransferase involved in cell wall biosynthesis